MTKPGGSAPALVLLGLALAVHPPASAQEGDAGAPSPGGTIVVGSKNFAENRLLGELFAQLIEAHTELEVERRLGLAGTEFCFEALRTGSIDLYPEYTGTGLVTLLGEDPTASKFEALAIVRAEFLKRFDLHWLAPIGFENSYELAIRADLARSGGRQLRTISDLVPVAPTLRAGFGYEFVERGDGLPGLADTYGLQFGDVQSILQAPKYQAAAAGAVDVIDAYTTDGRLLVYDLLVLEDDLGFFPPYEAAPLVRGDTLKRHPEVGAVLGLLGQAIDEGRMRALNLRLQEEHEPIEVVAHDLLRELELLPGDVETVTPDRQPKTSGLVAYMWSRRRELLGYTGEHIGLSAVSLTLGILFAVPLALLLDRLRIGTSEALIRIIGMSQTLPSLALFGFLIPLLGVGVVPSVVALWIYSIFPILRSSCTGLREADPDAASAATALGMTEGQVLRRVRLPLAVPTIMAGVRTAGVITVGTATIAAFIGAGGLGQPIIAGVQLVNIQQILSGAIPAALLALAADAALGALGKWLRPRGVGP
ncbi:MAG: ABC transporter permease subunit [Holophagales bacterium]|nr:ABC transporter permease subunit [Holophagales bacterium]MYD23199.1 ABC transporter permease subunit [Holophagales bacterium]MYI33787.1 ABC transporter permease subunit [Holophagales bacterium]